MYQSIAWQCHNPKYEAIVYSISRRHTVSLNTTEIEYIRHIGDGLLSYNYWYLSRYIWTQICYLGNFSRF